MFSIYWYYLQVILSMCVLQNFLGTKGYIINLATKITTDDVLPEKSNYTRGIDNKLVCSVMKHIPLNHSSEVNNEEEELERKKRQTEFPLSETAAQQNNICTCQTGKHDDMMYEQIAPVVSAQPQSPTQANQNDELLKAERINKGFERMLQFVTVAGQIDNYISDRARSFIQNLAKVTEDNNKSCGHRRT